MNAQTDLWLDIEAEQRRQQFRMRRLQLFNWGTFSGLHDIRIAHDGFLIVGRSGSGKSTLLDALAALLVPPQWLIFNAAAREGDRSRRDRNFASYVRGAWGDQKDSDTGEIATRYLRASSTWSALALTYANQDGRTITLMQLYWLRGSAAGNADVRKHYMIAERVVDIGVELQEFDFDVRALKQRLPDVEHYGDTFSAYAHWLRYKLGIDSELAQKLLHKTQSAKNLGDLNQFLREFMLDPPQTFAAAERLVTEFAVLDAAHQEVVTARLQTETLRPAREGSESLRGIDAEISEQESMLAAIDGYSDSLRASLLAEKLLDLDTRDRGLAGEEIQQQERLGDLQQQLLTLESEHRERGGERIEALEQQHTQAAIQRDERLKRRTQAEAACRTLEWSLPRDARTFSKCQGQARAVADAWQQDQEVADARRDTLRDALRPLESEFADARREIDAMQRQPSNIPSHMLELRRAISDSLGIHESELPFAGELIQIRPDAADWSGAIERVLHGFALSLLVDERRYASVSAYVNDNHLGARLVYFRIGNESGLQSGTPGHQSLVRKLELKESTCTAWLAARLGSSFDYACVDSVQELRREKRRALTREGQVRHGPDRHEKDDRHRIDDRRRWVLGFDNREKLALYMQRAQELAVRIEATGQQLQALSTQRASEQARYAAAITLGGFEWADIDVGSSLERIRTIDEQLTGLREGDATLRALGERIDEQRGRVDQTRAAMQKLGIERGTIAAKRAEVCAEQQATRDRLVTETLPDPRQRGLLDQRFAAVGNATLASLEPTRSKVERLINAELSGLQKRRGETIRVIEDAFAEFKRQWAAESASLDPTLAAASEFLAMLQRLEHDDLPRHEQRFFELLQEQSSENLAALNMHLMQARKDIYLRMEVVNEGLANAEFNEGTHLQIDISDRHLPDVREFREQVQQILGRAWDMDRASAEQRFLILRDLVRRLDKHDGEQRHWREQVLDVRLHVEFIGRETNASGVVVELYRSGAGKSGGQREKLATTCLAAALRYQLGGSDGGVPSYASVVLDEAFGKADNEFTELAMRIFEKFGFQMIVATPLKSVMTLEPFIGGACFVDIADRNRSAILPIEYDSEQHRLQLPAHAANPAA